MRTWLLYFIVGEICGGISRQHSILFWVLSLLISLDTLFFVEKYSWLLRRLFQKYCIGILGFLWGFSHNAPVGLHSQSYVEILNVNPGFAGEKALFKEKTGALAFASFHEIPTVLGMTTEKQQIGIFRTHASYLQNFPKTEKSSLATSTFFGLPVEKYRIQLAQKLKSNPSSIRGWLCGIYLGYVKDIPSEIKEAFKQLGVYHLLIISGLHFTLLSHLFLSLLSKPIQIFYTLRWINPRGWVWWRMVNWFFALFISIFYGWMIQLPWPTQRALLLFGTREVQAHLFMRWTSLEKMRIAIFIQSLFFPIGFLEVSNLLSWSAYMIIVSCTKRGTIWSLLLGQFALTLLVSALIGQLSVLGMFANFIFVPLFASVFYTGLGFFFTACLPDWLVHSGVFLHEKYLETILKLASLCDRFPILYWQLEGSILWVRAFSCFFSSIFLLNYAKNLSNTKEEAS